MIVKEILQTKAIYKILKKKLDICQIYFNQPKTKWKKIYYEYWNTE